MNKTIIALIVAVIALGVAIYFFQGKIIHVTPADTTVDATHEAPTNTMPVKNLPPTMEDGTIDSSASGTPTGPNTY